MKKAVYSETVACAPVVTAHNTALANNRFMASPPDVKAAEPHALIKL
jgi:hypothetical protein